MSKSYPCGGLGRRQFLAGGVALPLLGAFASSSTAADEPAKGGAASGGKVLGIPGPYPGRVIEARNKAMIRDGVKSRAAIKATVDRGMKELTGADDAVEASRAFFEPGDVVGIKMNPVGDPGANTNSELMLEVIEGLKSAGVKTKDMIVYERYRDEFIKAGMHKDVPDGIAWTGLGIAYDGHQLDIKGDNLKTGNLDHVTGYDPDQFVAMEIVGEGENPKDDRTRRSHLGLLLTRRVNKIVMLPVLKDHGSGGVTGALKNMSHGSVNNVARSHGRAETNVCLQFIPQVVSHPIIRQKCVLQIMDGIKGVFQKGPFGQNPEFIWEYNALFFATDPVAMDHVEWNIIDAKRKEKNLPPVAATGRMGLDPLKTEAFDFRQPQHIALAGNLGLGLFEFKSPRGRRFSINHGIIEVA